MSYLPPLPVGYVMSYHPRRNLLLGFHTQQPTLYLDEKTMEWRELDRHVAEVHPAQSPSTC